VGAFFKEMKRPKYDLETVSFEVVKKLIPLVRHLPSEGIVPKLKDASEQVADGANSFPRLNDLDPIRLSVPRT